MKLVDEGKLVLDRRLVEYRRPPYLGPDPALETITVRDVLRHSTGLPNWSDGPLVTIANPDQPTVIRAKNSFWLQLIMEQIAGQGTGAFMDRLLFAPAGMTGAQWAGMPGSLAPRLMVMTRPALGGLRSRTSRPENLVMRCSRLLTGGEADFDLDV